MKTKTILVSIFLLGLLGLLLCFNNSAYAVVLDNPKDKPQEDSSVQRAPAHGPLLRNPLLSRQVNEEQNPKYAPGDVIIKLKQKQSPGILFTQAYSKRCASDNVVLGNIKQKYSLTDEKPVFKGLHNRLKAKNLSARQSEEARLKRLNKPAAAFKAEKYVDLFPIYILKTDENVLEVCRSLKNDPDVEYAEPNYIAKIQMVPNDPYYHSSGSWGQPYDDLWGIKKIQCEQAWDISQGEGVVVAVIDSGVDYTHPDIAQNIWINPGEIPDNGIDDDGNGYIDDVRGYDFANNDNDPMDGCGHGTHCSGTIAGAGNNGIGVIGVAPNAKIMAIKGLGDNGSGSIDGLADAIHYAADNGANVLSNSWGASGLSEDDSKTLIEAFHYANNLNCVCIAAAGNSSANTSYFSPANIDTVIAVAASTQNDERCFFSNYGYKVDVSAPGGGYPDDCYNILSTMPDNSVLAGEHGSLKVSDGYWRLAGTSMACPHVAGLAALIKSAYPADSAGAVQSRLLAGADNIDGLNPGLEGLLGKGRANAYNSLTIQPGPLLKIATMEKKDIYPGRQGVIISHIKNFWLDATNVEAALSTTHPHATVQNAAVSLGDILSGQTVSNEGNPFTVILDENIGFGELIIFNLSLSGGNGYSETLQFSATTAFFENVGAQSGLPLASLLPVCTIMRDYNNDGYSDIFYTDIFTYGEFYKNLQNGRFVNITEESGLAGTVPQTVLFLDIDNDGDEDIFAGNYSALVYCQLFLNNGDETFTDISAASAIDATYFCFSAIAIDYNNDGLSDIFGSMGEQMIALLKNNGDNTFTNVTENARLLIEPSAGFWQAVAFDYDNDNDQDILTTELKLYRNNGKGTFTDVTAASGIDTSRGGCGGVAAADYNNDGYIDIFLTCFEPMVEGENRNILYKNNGNGTFSDATEEAGQVGLGTAGLWWGTDFFDYDNDGYQDLYITNDGHGVNITLINMLFKNNNNGVFTDITNIAFGSDGLISSAAACMGDYNNDGAMDIYAPLETFLGQGTGALFKNRIGLDNNWIKIKLEGIVSNRDAYGARVYVKTNGLKQLREVHTSSVETQPLHFGLGGAPCIDEIEIRWPKGGVQKIKNVSANRLITIEEAAPYFEPIPEDKRIRVTNELSFNVHAVDMGGGPLTYWAGFYNSAIDLDNDGDVDMGDASVIQDAFGAKRGDPRYVPKADLNNDGGISIFDIAIFRTRLNTYPQGVSFNTNTGAFSWMPVVGQEGIYKVTFCAFNASGCPYVSKTITIQVNTLADRPPVLNPIGNKTVNENELLQFTISAVDPDGDNIYYFAAFYNAAIDIDEDGNVDFDDVRVIKNAFGAKRGDPRYIPKADLNSDGGIGLFDLAIFRKRIQEYPQGASFNTNTGAFSWTPDFTQAGSYNVTFIASDGTLVLDDSETITITVNNVNRPPVLNPIGNKEVKEGMALQFTISGSDPDGGALTYSAQELPREATFNPATRAFYWKPGYDQAGNYNVTFKVSDGFLIDSETITITVTDVKYLPQKAGAVVLDEGKNKPAGESRGSQYVSGEVIVKFTEGAYPQAVLQSINLKAKSIERIYSIKPAVEEFKKEYPVENDKTDKEIFKEAYSRMPEAKKALYRSYKVTLPEGASANEAAAKLKNNPDVEYAEPNMGDI